MTDFFRRLSRYPRIPGAAFFCAALIALFIGGAQPFAVDLIPSPWDKFAHAGVFACIGITLGVIFGVSRPGALLVVVIGSVIVGMLDELHQVFLPGRHAGWDDLAADVVGALTAGLIVHAWRSFIRKAAEHRMPRVAR